MREAPGGGPLRTAVAAGLAVVLLLAAGLAGCSGGARDGAAPGGGPGTGAPDGAAAGTGGSGTGGNGAGDADGGGNGDGGSGNGAPGATADGSGTGAAAPAWLAAGEYQVTVSDAPFAPESWAHIPAGRATVRLTFPRPMDRPGVEQALAALPAVQEPGFAWRSDSELSLSLSTEPLRAVVFTLDGLPAADGRPWSNAGTVRLLPVPPARLLRVPPGGGAPAPFATLEGMGLAGGVPSPDGRYLLAVTQFSTAGGDYYQSWLVELASGRRMALGRWSHFSANDRDEWLPDSSAVVRMGEGEVTRYGIDGTATVLLPYGPYLHGMAVGPRTGRVAVLASALDDRDIHLLLLPPGGGDPRDMGAVEERNEVRPDGAFPYQSIWAEWAPSECCLALRGISTRFQWDLEPDIRTPTAAGDTLRSQRQPGGPFWLVTRAGEDPTPETQVLLAGDGSQLRDLDGCCWQWGPGGELWRTTVNPDSYDLLVQRLAPSGAAPPATVLRGTILGSLPDGGLLLLEWQW